ncbi:helix-turn-helix domain-containing protein [Deinococcus sp. QL22]|uniref:helix-turn-helix domain-containing protein n=1 Tax=Deinococcus sp. QL22 TaxID=2939437 RepID=UPI002016B687|nr:helix-turn-helix domain-containing protein [Deinococcus sp. QL22]UQN09926.1 helix-turn-helix domain-containing protein [Deinococcus sp. QL22]
MPTLAQLRAVLNLPKGKGAKKTFGTPEEAAALLPDHAAAQVQEAVLGLLAREALASPGLPTLLSTLRGAMLHARPEQELTVLLARLTGGRAEIRASWGDVVASSGTPQGQPLSLRLMHGGRHVGALLLHVPADWQPLLPIAAEYALLARLQSAAAGAARRRVGERTLEGLLSGNASENAVLDAEHYAVAVAAFSSEPAPGLRARTARAAALDVLAAVGEGYFFERTPGPESGFERAGVVYCTVQDTRAVWLWPTHELERESVGLHAALTASTAQDVRLGISGRHVGAGAARTASHEARQALAATRDARGLTLFHEMDVLYALLSGGALTTLKAQIQARLAVLDDDGRIEATLRAYLTHTGSLSLLAARQNLHVNTLRYRLRRAEEVLGSRLSDPQLLARLYLAFGAEEG